jgi:hypothetical protein
MERQPPSESALDFARISARLDAVECRPPSDPTSHFARVHRTASPDAVAAPSQDPTDGVGSIAFRDTNESAFFGRSNCRSNMRASDR